MGYRCFEHQNDQRRFDRHFAFALVICLIAGFMSFVVGCKTLEFGISSFSTPFCADVESKRAYYIGLLLIIGSSIGFAAWEWLKHFVENKSPAKDSLKSSSSAIEYGTCDISTSVSAEEEPFVIVGGLKKPVIA